MNYQEFAAIMDLGGPNGAFKYTKWAIEATSCESLEIWSDWHEGNSWEQCHGWWETIGHVYISDDSRGDVERMPVCVNMHWNLLNGHPVCFYDAMSQVVDYRMVEKYIDARVQRTTNAMNFSHCAHDIGLKYRGGKKSL